MSQSAADWIHVHRVIRELPAGDGAYPGTLVTSGDGVAVAVPASAPAAAGSWVWSGTEHIAAPYDIALGEGGAEALLPWCSEEVPMFLSRRIAASEPLTAGEQATLVVSMLRGLSELGRDVTTTAGAWWLSYDVRPMLVIGGSATAVEATRAVLQQLRSVGTDRRLLRVLDELDTALERPRSALTEIDRWESRILECAAPRALQRDVYAPAEVRHLDLPRERERAPRVVRRESTAWRDRALERAGALRERARELVARMRPRAKASSPPRPRRPMIVAALAAGAVIVGGLVWPSGGDDGSARAQERVHVMEEGEEQKDDPEQQAKDGRVERRPTDPLAAVPELVEALRVCAEAAAAGCPEALAEDSDAPWELLVERTGARHESALVDDYGDIAVVRLSTDDEQSDLIVVLARRDALWLVRDVYDALNQPE